MDYLVEPASLPRVSYPTRSLEFLNPHCSSTQNGIPTVGVNQAIVLLDVVIVGAGLGGLATAVALARQGHKVVVLEQAHALAEVEYTTWHRLTLDSQLTTRKVGAGIQIPSNSSRILLEWGLEPLFLGKAVEPKGMTFRRWENGEPIGYTKLVPDFRDNFDAPYYVIHRADFHQALHKLAQHHGVHLEVNCKVSKYDAEQGKVTTLDGRTFCGDLVIGADGMYPLMISSWTYF